MQWRCSFPTGLIEDLERIIIRDFWWEMMLIKGKCIGYPGTKWSNQKGMEVLAFVISMYLTRHFLPDRLDAYFTSLIASVISYSKLDTTLLATCWTRRSSKINLKRGRGLCMVLSY
jgi:hypothetical protein